MLEMPDKKEFSDLYLSHANITDLAIKYFVSTNTIGKWIKKFGLSKTGKYLKKEDIEKLFKKKMTHIKMAKELDCSGPTLTSYLKKFGLKESKPNLINIKEMYELRVNSKWTFEELAELYKTTNNMIQTRCREHNFPRVKVDQEARTWRRVGGVKNET